jgi:hypothetical protein
MSTLAVVEKILRETGVPMSVREIVEAAGETLPTKSKTPDTVVARDLSMDIKRKGETSIFIRTSPGRYTMREIWQAKQAADESKAAATDDATTEVLARAMRHDRQATIAAKRTVHPGAEQKHQG